MDRVIPVPPEADTPEIPRDRWGRPLILSLWDDGEQVPYTRASTLAKALDDTSNLMAWKQRMTSVGLLQRPDLMTKLAGVVASGSLDDKTVKRDLNRICREATEAAGASSGASSGTGLHALTEAIDLGREPEFVPADVAPRLDAYRAATKHLGVEAVEQFVVNDQLQVAGTFDRLYRLADGRVVVGDLKTGKSEPSFPGAVAIQEAIYAHGQSYNPGTGKRSPIHDDLDPDVGLLVHLPPWGGCDVFELNLRLGWQDALLAASVRDSRTRDNGDIIRPHGRA